MPRYRGGKGREVVTFSWRDREPADPLESLKSEYMSELIRIRCGEGDQLLKLKELVEKAKANKDEQSAQILEGLLEKFSVKEMRAAIERRANAVIAFLEESGKAANIGEILAIQINEALDKIRERISDTETFSILALDAVKKQEPNSAQRAELQFKEELKRWLINIADPDTLAAYDLNKVRHRRSAPWENIRESLRNRSELDQTEAKPAARVVRSLGFGRLPSEYLSNSPEIIDAAKEADEIVKDIILA